MVTVKTIEASLGSCRNKEEHPILRLDDADAAGI